MALAGLIRKCWRLAVVYWSGAYLIIILHNLLLVVLKVDTQGEEIVKVFSELNSPVWFFIVGAVFAPLVEETFFRGFLFQGFRERHGWKAGMLLSSAIFAAAHLDPVALIPTFILGSVLAYLYHRSNSVWPGDHPAFSRQCLRLIRCLLRDPLSEPYSLVISLI